MFLPLSIQSLFNVSLASDWLHPAARQAYKWKFGKTQACFIVLKPLKVSRKGYVFGRKHTALTDLSTTHIITGLKTCLQYLRLFGSCLSDLMIDYEVSYSMYRKYVHQYISDYCGDNLERITFAAMPNIDIDEWNRKVFTNVNEVQFEGGNLGQQWATITKCFPNVRVLDIESADIEDRLIGKSFEHLERLYVYNFDWNGFAMDDIVGDLLDGAHQLKCLWITVAEDDVSIGDLLTMINACPSINTFRYGLGVLRVIPVNTTEVDRIVNECPALNELELPDHRFTANDTVTLIRQLNSLKTFQFQMANSERTELVSQLNGSEWDVEIDDEYAADDNHSGVTLNRQM